MRHLTMQNVCICSALRLRQTASAVTHIFHTVSLIWINGDKVEKRQNSPFMFYWAIFPLCCGDKTALNSRPKNIVLAVFDFESGIQFSLVLTKGCLNIRSIIYTFDIENLLSIHLRIIIISIGLFSS